MGYIREDILVAEHYAPQILRPLKYGENSVFYWIPGSGMTSILQNIFGSKKLLSKYLRGYSGITYFHFFWGHLAESKDSESLLRSNKFNNYSDLESYVKSTLDGGREITLIVGRIDDFPEKEKVKILKNFIRIASVNRNRIHIIFNTFDKPWFEKILLKTPELVFLANFMEIVPVLAGKILEQFVTKKSEKYATKLSKKKLAEVTKIYGGIIQLTKEYLRSKGESSLMEVKFRINWNNFPKEYKTEIENYILNKITRRNSSTFRDLKRFGVIGLNLFSKFKNVMNINPDAILSRVLTPEERNFYRYLKENRKKVIDKETAMNILRPDNSLEISLWAIDQAVSRFRKKLIRAGADPDSLATLKGKGYIWKD